LSAALLRPEPLTKDAFGTFGEVIEVEGSQFYLINDGMVQRYHDLVHVNVGAEGGRPIINLFRGRPYTYPLTVTSLERHPLGSQAFMPLSATPFAIIVAPPGESIAAGDLRAFVTDGRQGINYRRGTWHHVLLTLERESDFLVVDRAGPGKNCEVLELPAGQQRVFDPR
jgi:ureidoglycolate lyase